MENQYSQHECAYIPATGVPGHTAKQDFFEQRVEDREHDAENNQRRVRETPQLIRHEVQIVRA